MFSIISGLLGEIERKDTKAVNHSCAGGCVPWSASHVQKMPGADKDCRTSEMTPVADGDNDTPDRQPDRLAASVDQKTMPHCGRFDPARSGKWLRLAAEGVRCVLLLLPRE